MAIAMNFPTNHVSRVLWYIMLFSKSIKFMTLCKLFFEILGTYIRFEVQFKVEILLFKGHKLVLYGDWYTYMVS